MENDPNKKESKGKRIFKKALRRSSKSSSNSEAAVGGSRSKSFDSKPPPSPGAGGGAHNHAGLSDTVKPKKVEIHESHNKTIGEASGSDNNDKLTGLALAAAVEQRVSVSEGTKRNLKRKLEDESGAGTSGASAGASDTDADDKDPSKDKKKKNRCAVCRKKVGLTGFECRCGGLFCAVHRYSDKHACSFDYRELGAQEIRRNNPVVVSQKIHKI